MYRRKCNGAGHGIGNNGVIGSWASLGVCRPFIRDKSVARIRNEGGGFAAQDDEKRCPALPNAPVEPAPLFHPIKGQHAPRATPETHAKKRDVK